MIGSCTCVNTYVHLGVSRLRNIVNMYLNFNYLPIYPSNNFFCIVWDLTKKLHCVN